MGNSLWLITRPKNQTPQYERGLSARQQKERQTWAQASERRTCLQRLDCNPPLGQRWPCVLFARNHFTYACCPRFIINIFFTPGSITFGQWIILSPSLRFVSCAEPQMRCIGIYMDVRVWVCIFTNCHESHCGNQALIKWTLPPLPGTVQHNLRLQFKNNSQEPLL